MIFNGFNQILTTLNQFKIQFNQVSALLFNLIQEFEFEFEFEFGIYNLDF